jgi:16S rRNA (adenine1518-N6/adenine1519-N6)-dimethyltransferase
MVLGCTVMVQKEMADRMLAKESSSHRGAFSLLIQSYFAAKKAFDVGPGAFTPPPKVKSTVLTLFRLKEPVVQNPELALLFEKFCKDLFSRRRKMVRSFLNENQMKILNKTGLDGTQRPEDLELQTIYEIFRVL